MALESPVFVGSIDQGTTSSRFLIFDRDGRLVASHQEEFSQLYPNSGWHEHVPEEILSSVRSCIEEAVAKFTRLGHSTESIKAVGITNQRETTVVWDTKTGKALHNAVVWTDTRAASIVRDLKFRLNGSDRLTQKCGLPLSTYPSATKLLWLLQNDSTTRECFDRGDLAFGTIDTWLVYKLNGIENNVFVSDASNASRTMFMDLRTLQYSNELLDFFSTGDLDLKRVHMPAIVPSSHPTAFGRINDGVLRGCAVTSCLGDQSAALVGQKGLQPGDAKNTYGTGCFLLYNVGDVPAISSHGLLATVAYHFGDKPVFALEGSIAVAGSGVKFLMENMGFAHTSAHITDLAESVEDNGGLIFVTAFSGLFAPYWIDDTQGTLFGLTMTTQRGHIARAILEAVCYQTKAILDAMEKDSGRKLKALAVDGGMSNSDLCMQTQADLIGIPIVRPHMRETTALGAAIAAGYAVGVWKDLSELGEINTAGQKVFEASMERSKSTAMCERWEQAVEMSKGWVKKI